MRAQLLIATLLALSACNKSAAVDNSADAADELTADSIVSNDVTAIDAVTGAAANMAADVDVNYGLDVRSNSNNVDANSGAAKKPAATRKPAAADSAESNSAAPATANTTSNAE